MTLLALAALSACATQPSPPAEPTRFIEPPPPAVVTQVVPVPVSSAPPASRPRAPNPERASREAQESSLQMPDPSLFKGKELEYPYHPNLWYEVYAELGSQTVLLLEEGEIIEDITEDGGGTIWQVGYNYRGGDGSPRRASVKIKPVLAGESTRIIIDTKRRSYDVRARSFPAQRVGRSVRHLQVSWSYPQQQYDAMRARLAADAADSPGAGLGGSGRVGADVLPGCKTADYELWGDGVEWFPVDTEDGLPRVCNDGKRVRINFPANLGAIPQPGLWQVDDEDGTNPRAIHYRTIGSTYVVDNLPRLMMLGLADDRVFIRERGREGGR